MTDTLGEQKNWKRQRLKWCFRSCRNGVWGNEPDGIDDIPVVRVADFDRIALRVNFEDPTLRSIQPQELGSRGLSCGDLLIEKSGGGEQQPVGAVVGFDFDGPAVCSNFIAKLEVADGFHARFLVYLNAALYNARVNTRSIKQTTGIQNLDSDSYLNELVDLPTFNIQKTVANYLDRETSAIDKLISEKESMLSLLEEKRQALVSHAVTQGLSPKAKMKFTGIEWLETIPKHWAVERIKFHIYKIEQGWSPQCENVRAEPDEWGVLKVGAVNSWEFNPIENKRLPDELDPVIEYQIKPRDVLMSRANTTQLLGSVVFVRDVDAKLMLCDKLYRLEIDERRLNREFAVAFLRSRPGRVLFEMEASGASNSMQNIGQDTVKNTWIPIPPIEEQAEIVTHLFNERYKSNKMSDALRDSIVLLKERRSALITAAVTGQIPITEMT
jgi:type I restriction enzyme, S subunit